jgi:single-strand DNA-binding protein
MLNRVVLIGRLTRDPESQYTPSGIAIAKFTVAVDRFSKNPETGEKETDFIPVVAFRRSAEFVTQYITKGRLVAVEGRIQVRSWVAQDGQKRWMTEVIADNVQGLDRPRDGEASAMGGSDYGDAGGYSAPAPAGAPAARRPAPPPMDNIDDSDPFADE